MKRKLLQLAIDIALLILVGVIAVLITRKFYVEKNWNPDARDIYWQQRNWNEALVNMVIALAMAAWVLGMLLISLLLKSNPKKCNLISIGIVAALTVLIVILNLTIDWYTSKSIVILNNILAYFPIFIFGFSNRNNKRQAVKSKEAAELK